MARVPPPILAIGALMLLLALALALTRDSPAARAQPQPVVSQPVIAAAWTPRATAGPDGWRSQVPGVAGMPPLDPGAGRQVGFLNFAPTITAGSPRPHGDRGPCADCHDIVAAPTVAMPAAPLPAPRQLPALPLPNQRGVQPLPPPAAPQQRWNQPAVVGAGQGNCFANNGGTPVAANTGAGTLPMLPFQEAHWQGLELISLTPGLARVLGIPRNFEGVIIDEVTMPADMQGFAAGDLITTVGRRPTTNLESFIDAADRVRDKSRVTIEVIRKGQARQLVLSARRLGTANGETAPMIQSGAVPPHGNLGPCTNCHHIGNGGKNAVDLGDLLAKTAPPISAGQKRPHQDRGRCSSCHVIR